MEAKGKMASKTLGNTGIDPVDPLNFRVEPHLTLISTQQRTQHPIFSCLKSRNVTAEGPVDGPKKQRKSAHSNLY
jgi:hypothetical protein